SHSSKNKLLVGAVFSDIKAASAHYDVVTFEEGKATDAEIEEAFKHTDLFVLFASEAALQSPWVQKEIDLAKQAHKAGKLSGVQVFLLDGLERKKLPDWLQEYIYSKKSNARLIAKQIRSRLLDIAIASDQEIQLWVNRDADVREITAAFASLSNDPPNVLFLS